MVIMVLVMSHMADRGEKKFKKRKNKHKIKGSQMENGETERGNKLQEKIEEGKVGESDSIRD